MERGGAHSVGTCGAISHGAPGYLICLIAASGQGGVEGVSLSEIWDGLARGRHSDVTTSRVEFTSCADKTEVASPGPVSTAEPLSWCSIRGKAAVTGDGSFI